MVLPGRFSCNIEGQYLSCCIASIIHVFIDVVPMCMSCLCVCHCVVLHQELRLVFPTLLQSIFGGEGEPGWGWISCASRSIPMTLRPCALSLGLRDLCSMLSTVFRLTPTLPTSFLSSICLYVGLCEHSL